MTGFIFAVYAHMCHCETWLQINKDNSHKHTLIHVLNPCAPHLYYLGDLGYDAAYRVMTISLDPMSHVLFFLQAKWQPLTCQRKKKGNTYVLNRGVGRWGGCRGEYWWWLSDRLWKHTLPLLCVTQKQTQSHQTISVSPVLMDKWWFFPNETFCPCGNTRWGLTNGGVHHESDTVVLWVSGPMGRVSHCLSSHECLPA